jgi:hypothetical protein
VTSPLSILGFGGRYFSSQPGTGRVWPGGIASPNFCAL